MSLNSIGANFGITTSRKTMYQETSTSCPADCAVTAKCGDSKVEGTETCDDGSKNSDTIPGACNTKCT
jgi:hypothetical protein